MITKAKIFMFALFSPNKHMPLAKLPTKWYHKCILVLVRQHKNFKECPEEIRHYDWERALAKFYVYCNRATVSAFTIAGITGARYWRNREMERTEEMFEARQKEGREEIEKYEMKLTPDTYYHKYNTQFPANYKYT